MHTTFMCTTPQIYRHPVWFCHDSHMLVPRSIFSQPYRLAPQWIHPGTPCKWWCYIDYRLWDWTRVGDWKWGSAVIRAIMTDESIVCQREPRPSSMSTLIAHREPPLLQSFWLPTKSYNRIYLNKKGLFMVTEVSLTAVNVNTDGIQNKASTERPVVATTKQMTLGGADVMQSDNRNSKHCHPYINGSSWQENVSHALKNT